jgi:hypothetical protein
MCSGFWANGARDNRGYALGEGLRAHRGVAPIVLL